ncbi:MAG: PSP1 domain-containing protein [Bacteroides sp.]
MEKSKTISSRGELFVREEIGEFYICDSGFGAAGEYDWGADFTKDIHENAIVQVQFKHSRRGFYANRTMLPVRRGDVVAVSALGGHDIGVVCLTGWLAQRQYQQQQCLNEDDEHSIEPLPDLYRKATQQDIERWIEATDRELATMLRARVIAQEMHLQMKISDVEFQGDGSKALFYYSAEQRVDFRELVRALAGEFKIRIEMRQIGPRQEAARIGGIGSCGRTICCGKWLRKFSSVTTGIVKLQDLTPNPQKQAGQCGKLKCCLNFEVDVYNEAKRKQPRVKAPLQLEDCVLYHVKNDLFRDCMYFSTSPKGIEPLLMLTSEQVNEILELNHSGRKGVALATFQFAQNSMQEEETQLGYGNVIEEESLTRFDRAKKKNHGRNKNKKNNTKSAEGTNTQTESQNNPSKKNTIKPQEETKKNNEQQKPRRDLSKRESNNKTQAVNSESQTSQGETKQQRNLQHQQPRREKELPTKNPTTGTSHTHTNKHRQNSHRTRGEQDLTPKQQVDESKNKTEDSNNA